jgi:hypothetical protein
MSGDNANGLVESIEIAARSGNNGDFFMIKKIDADGTFLAGGDQTHRFYNEGLYEPIALQESNQIFDDVPRTAGTLEFANNRVIPGNCKNGYDKITADYDLEVIYNDAIAPSKWPLALRFRLGLKLAEAVDLTMIRFYREIR